MKFTDDNSPTTETEPVKTGLGSSNRELLAESLSCVLADTYVLLVKTHVFHWNVVGPLFLPIHELTEQHYNDLFKAADDIAERIRALGHPAPLSFTNLKPKSVVSEERLSRSAHDIVAQLVEDHEEIVRRLRDISETAADYEDFVTHDLLNARLGFHEKAIWMLRAIIAV
jgi:starvation-inducible DNA-binding protein